MGFIARKRQCLLVAVLATLTLFPSLPARAISRSDLEARTASLKKSLSQLSARIATADTALEESEAAVALHARLVATAQTRIARLRTAYARHSLALYMVASDSIFQTLASAANLDVLAERLGLLEQVRSRDLVSTQELVALQRRSRIESRELARARDASRVARDSLVRTRRTLDAQFREYQTLLDLAILAQGRSTAKSSRGRISGFACPVAGPRAFSNDYGAPRGGGPHAGVDMQAPYGTPVVAVLPSRVAAVPHGGWMGHGIIIRDASGTEWWYAHLSSTYVKVGEALSTGEVIGRVGCSGNCTGPHLHFEYHPGGGSARNPYRILSAAC